MRFPMVIVLVALVASIAWFLLRVPTLPHPSSPPAVPDTPLPDTPLPDTPLPDSSESRSTRSDSALSQAAIAPQPDHVTSPPVDVREAADEAPLSRAGGTLRVMVNEAVLAAFDHIDVHVEGSGGHRVALDDSGVGELTGLCVGSRAIVMVGGAFSPIELEVDLRADDVTEVHYAPNDRETVTVEVRGWDGPRVADARVFAVLRTFDVVERDLGSTNAEGRLEVCGAGDPRMAIRVEAAGYGPTVFLTLGEWFQGDLLVLVLEPAARAVAQVRDADGTPVEGVVVAIERIEVHDPFARWPRRTTDESGEAHFRDLPVGTLRAYFGEGDRMQTIEFVTRPGSETVVEHEWDPEQWVLGRVRCNGVPVAGGTLAVLGRVLELDSSGEFRGEVPLGWAAPVYTSAGPERIRVAFAERELAIRAHWALDYMGHDVEIREIYPNRATPPMRTLRLLAQRSDGSSNEHASIDLDGNAPATFRGLPAGRYLLRVQYREPVASYAPPVMIEVDRNLTIDFQHLGVTELVATQAVPRGAQVSLIDVDGSKNALPVLSRDPLRVAWPVALAGRGVIQGGERAPVFFAVDELGRMTPTEWVATEGGVVDFWSFESEHDLTARLIPRDETHGPMEFWENERFSIWNEARVQAGRYRVTVFDGERVVTTREIEVVNGETTTLVP
ncbi:MAG: carboxypeptidase-like regulatory domain-containing protein [Planctomycetota bacterium]